MVALEHMPMLQNNTGFDIARILHIQRYLSKISRDICKVMTNFDIFTNGIYL